MQNGNESALENWLQTATPEGIIIVATSIDNSQSYIL